MIVDMITERQAEILRYIVKDFIDLAYPISSELLEKRHDLGICSATIRLEMQKLTKEKFLFKPHTSSGRIPTDKGYRFFVNDLLANCSWKESKENEPQWLKECFKEFNNIIKFIQSLTKSLARISSLLVVNYLSDEEIILKEGWEEILKEPEFENKKMVDSFVQFISHLDSWIKKIELNSQPKIFIGKETCLPKGEDFSIICGKYHFSKRNSKINGVISLIGPKRMNYYKNLKLINFVFEQ
jgi:heat-inducible transcriptional repressor